MDAEKLDLLYRAHLTLARKNFAQFMDFVITENDEGFPVPAPVMISRASNGLQFPDPLKQKILDGVCLARPQPWPHLAEMADDLASGRSLIYLKARQMWFSWMIAAYGLFRSLERGNVFVLSQGQEYADAVIDKVRYIKDRLPDELILPLQKSNTREISFVSAGGIKSFPSTEDSVRSLSGRIVIVDEAAFHRYGEENYRAYRPSISGSGGQLIMVSTANGPHGFFHTMFKNAQATLNDYDWRFYPWSSRPDHDRKWYERERRAYAGFDADFLRENPSNPDEAFSQLSGVVYPSFNPQVHVGPPKIPYEQCFWRGAGVDFGGSAGNPNAVVIMGVSREGHVYQYDEFCPPGVLSIEEIGVFISKWKSRAPMQIVECDHQETSIQTLRKTFGLPARKAEKKREGLEITDFLLQNNRLTIDPGCVRSVEEFYGYRWREALDPNSRERYQTKTPVDNHADLMDARRYFLRRIWKQIMLSGTTVGNLSGKQLARSAV